jgi:hypothetical protein
MFTDARDSESVDLKQTLAIMSPLPRGYHAVRVLGSMGNARLLHAETQLKPIRTRAAALLM